MVTTGRTIRIVIELVGVPNRNVARTPLGPAAEKVCRWFGAEKVTSASMETTDD